MASCLDLDSCENHPIMTSVALLLDHLALGTQLLEYHFRVAALMGIGVVEAHFDTERMLSMLVRTEGCVEALVYLKIRGAM